MAEKKKILYIVEAMGGGVFTYIVDLANELVNKYDMYIAYAEKTESKIAELEEYLRNVRAAQKKEEDNEIVRAIRSTKLGGRDLLALLENIQAGNVTFQTTVNNENKTSEEAEMEDSCGERGEKAGLYIPAESIYRRHPAFCNGKRRQQGV